MPHIKDYTGKRAHMIGIGGSSMSGLAGMLMQAGVIVTGSDGVASYMTKQLCEQGIPVTIGHFERTCTARTLSFIPPPSARKTPSAQKPRALAFRRWSAPRCSAS